MNEGVGRRGEWGRDIITPLIVYVRPSYFPWGRLKTPRGSKPFPLEKTLKTLRRYGKRVP